MRVTFHIGANKTGSSAIQRWLAINAPTLREHGIYVPTEDLMVSGPISGNHVNLMQRMLNQWPRESELVHVLTEIERGINPREVVFSAENLAAHINGPELVDSVAQHFDTRVLLFIRRQDEFLPATWAQWHAKTRTDFWAWMLSVVGQLGNWQHVIEAWHSDRFETTVQLHCDQAEIVLAGYLETTGEYIWPRVRTNQRIDPSILSLACGNRQVFETMHDNGFHAMVEDLTGTEFLGGPDLLTPSQRNVVLARYADSNEWVRQMHFPRYARLFDPVIEEDFVKDDRLGSQLSFLTTCIYALYKRAKETPGKPGSGTVTGEEPRALGGRKTL